MISLLSGVQEISKVGASTARLLRNVGIEFVEDLLFHFPFRYEDFTTTTLIKDLRAGVNANIVGHIEIIQNKRSPRQRMNITEALVNDGSGATKIVWFNQPFIARSLGAGDRVSISGKVEEDFSGAFFRSPNYEKIDKNKAMHTQGMVPIYSLTGNLTQKQIRFLIGQIIHLTQNVADFLPVEVKTALNLCDLSDALRKIHFPHNQSELNQARYRLAFDELFLLQMKAQVIKAEISGLRARSLKFYEQETRDFVAGLPFELTADQKISAWQILRDLEKEIPMARLLEGDVGSGKTVVAAIAMLSAALNGSQAVLMAPTEILARQHFDSISKLFSKADMPVILRTRSQKIISTGEVEKGGIDKAIKNGEANIIIGTHALIQEKIEFSDLGLAIIDEQHRFGVKQRKALTEKSQSGVYPHLLSMTATPIPRSLALALWGDLSVSIIKTKPANRLDIVTRLVAEDDRASVYEFIRRQIEAGRQAFVVCPLIDASDAFGAKSVKEEFEKLDKVIFKDLKIEFLHGRMKSEEKERIMSDFLENKIKILIATSVVEVGVDIPNASVMVIEGADRFGLAQLHQFRGRVGRGEHQSHCLVFGEMNNPATAQRLKIFESCSDGFVLAREDLKMRGPGEVYGKMQKGFPELKIANIMDYNLMRLARDEAARIFAGDNTLKKWPKLLAKIEEMDFDAHIE